MLAEVDASRRGRLEFRQVLEGSTLLAAIHDFAPRLPWLLYRLTQAVAHLFVMAPVRPPSRESWRALRAPSEARVGV